MELDELLIRPIKQQKLINLALRYCIAYKLNNKVYMARLKQQIKESK
jgi:hypothetical protein